MANNSCFIDRGPSCIECLLSIIPQTENFSWDSYLYLLFCDVEPENKSCSAHLFCTNPPFHFGYEDEEERKHSLDFLIRSTTSQDIDLRNRRRFVRKCNHFRLIQLNDNRHISFNDFKKKLIFFFCHWPEFLKELLFFPLNRVIVMWVK